MRQLLLERAGVRRCRACVCAGTHGNCGVHSRSGGCGTGHGARARFCQRRVEGSAVGHANVLDDDLPGRGMGVGAAKVCRRGRGAGCANAITCEPCARAAGLDEHDAGGRCTLTVTVVADWVSSSLLDAEMCLPRSREGGCGNTNVLPFKMTPGGRGPLPQPA